MSEIPSIAIEHEGVVYDAECSEDSKISYKGVDKDGNKVSTTPEVVMSMARSYGEGYAKSNASADAKPEGQKENLEKGENHFEIETDGQGGWKLKSGNKSKLSAKQLEWCEMMAKAAIGKQAGSVAYGQEGKADSKFSEGGNFKEEVRETWPWSQMKKDFKQIAEGMVRDTKDFVRPPFQMIEDAYKFGNMIGKGKFREATGKAAEKISENLKVMIGMDTKDESKLYGINKFANRIVKQALEPYKQMGRNIKGLFDRLSGRGNVKPIGRVAPSGNANTGPNKGIER
ncbi:MAG: hypothetical protein MJ210_01255 [Alphaproteobacteria bacterium]|nr:hypothetical protein [Alphaproteobacteria bacterium]